MLMHDGASWISVSIQIVTLSFVLIAAFLVENLTLALVTYTVGVFVALALESRIHASGTAGAVDQVLAHSPI